MNWIKTSEALPPLDDCPVLVPDPDGVLSCVVAWRRTGGRCDTLENRGHRDWAWYIEGKGWFPQKAINRWANTRK